MTKSRGHNKVPSETEYSVRTYALRGGDDGRRAHKKGAENYNEAHDLGHNHAGAGHVDVVPPKCFSHGGMRATSHPAAATLL
ncbi:hypothetical protein G6O67_008012 [Ophiocordyceps sinensis]|uniref:Uncharacterized protein n=1 Tax=Ophiocordyceps sinensis TaxID=72228 RepID=A0A8H4LS13_9HYPO|nr:hypothetical protein G6O67_008012 [Ophiocordyceps sinensis]